MKTLHRMRQVLCPAAAGLALVLTGGTAQAQQAPAKMIMYTMKSSCPAGWKDADYLEGVLAVTTGDAQKVGFRNGWNTLGNREDRTHEHCCKGSMDVPYYNMSAAAGPNYSGAGAGHYEIDVQLQAAPSGLPFLQMKVCEKT